MNAGGARLKRPRMIAAIHSDPDPLPTHTSKLSVLYDDLAAE